MKSIGDVVKRDPIGVQGIYIGFEPLCSVTPGEEG
jgi:hypothetical protein